jgi:rod shape-determining protein MreC
MSRTTSRTLFAGALLLAAVSLLVLSVSGFLQPAQGALLRPLSAVQGWVSTRFMAARELIVSPRDIATLRAQNAELQAEVARLQQQVIALQEKAAEADILAALIGYARTQPESRYVAANVIGRDVSPFLRAIWIGAGTDAGIARGMPVVTEQGLVGRIEEVFPTIARVQLVTDPQAAVNVRLQDSRSEGITIAQLNGELRIDQIDQNVSVRVNELVLTSGLGGNYPSDITVGQVISVRRRDYEIFQQAVIQPSVDFESLEVVLVITSFRPLELQGQ